jgi:hypothetical protein
LQNVSETYLLLAKSCEFKLYVPPLLHDSKNIALGPKKKTRVPAKNTKKKTITPIEYNPKRHLFPFFFEPPFNDPYNPEMPNNKNTILPT